MRIGIVGAGQIGGTLAALFVDVGHEVVLANSRGPRSLAAVIEPLGAAARAGRIEEAAQAGEIVVLAIPFNRYLELPAEPFGGRIVVDAGNYDIGRDGHFPRLDRGEITSGELLAAHLSGARVIKGFNTIYYVRLRDERRAGLPLAQRLAIPIAGDDPVAKEVVARLIDEIGFAPVDTGSLAESRRQEYGTPVFNQPVGPDEATVLLGRVA
jgi:predicted dinucleotide-binding enzyme